MVFRFSVSPAAGLFAAFVDLVDGRPGPAFGLAAREAALLITFLDVLGLTFFLVGIFRFVAAGHENLLINSNAALSEPRPSDAAHISGELLIP
jgi:hypothetical protein